MQIGMYKFDRMELSGSLGDLGTLLPFSVALMVITGLSVTSVLLMIGIFYILSGAYYKLPIPVQPLKVVSAIAIAYPEKVSLTMIGASGIIIGLILLLLAVSGIIDQLAKFFTKPIVRGIQLGLGFILITRGIQFIIKPQLFLHHSNMAPVFPGISLNLAIGIMGFFIALLLLSNKRFPSALVLVTGGMVLGVIFGSLNDVGFSFGPTPVALTIPGSQDLINALIILVIPQIPLTLGNAVMGTADACYTYFGKGKPAQKVTYRALAMSMGAINVLVGLIGAMPMCHGAGGLAAHYRFGARTGGSNIMIGIIFLTVGVVFGKIGISLLSSIPNSILGILLLFAGIELAVLIKDVSDKKDLFISILIAGIGFATTHMGVAFVIGILAMYLIRWKKIDI